MQKEMAVKSMRNNHAWPPTVCRHVLATIGKGK
jgi:hypothetical protein